MALRDFYTVDVVGESPSGDRELWLVEAEWVPEREALDFVELIIKLGNVESYAAGLRDKGANVRLRVHSVVEPPSSVIAFLQRRGVTTSAGKPDRRAIGRPARYPNLPSGEPDIDALQAANAASFAEVHGLNGTVDSMAAVDRVLEEWRRERGLGAATVDEDREDGDLTVLAGAYTGQVIHQMEGGHWTLGAVGPTWPVHYLLDDGTRVNALAKVSKYLKYGAGDSVASLVSWVRSRHTV